MKSLKYSEIVSLNRALARQDGGRPFKVLVLANIVVNQLKDVLEYALRLEGVNAEVFLGAYDNILQESLSASDSDVVIIFQEAWNLVDGASYRVESLGEDARTELLEKVEQETLAALENLKSRPLVLVNRLSAALFSSSVLTSQAFRQLCAEANETLTSKLPDNARLVDIDGVFKCIGTEYAVDWRLFYSAKSPYTVAFYKHYAELVRAPILALAGKAKKVLVLDCDNTLWGGVVGEDGMDGVGLGPDKPHGHIFTEVQHLALALQKRGVLLGLCSKNNPDDVDEMLRSHPDMVIKDHHLVIKKVNWSDKAANLRAIAHELNIGLDSIVFVDDSAFEIELLREQLPEVTTLLVPPRLVDYPGAFRNIADRFIQLTEAAEDRNKTEQYRLETDRQALRGNYDNIEDYLRSLSLQVNVYVDETQLAPRISQLTQKTNQFNLTTRRYAEHEIADLMRAANVTVYAFRVLDKFGDYGITGVAILRRPDRQTAEIDTFLMSCRVLGRNVEAAFMRYLIEQLRSEGVSIVKAAYIATMKNGQVAALYDQFGFTAVDRESDRTSYTLRLSPDTLPPAIDYVSVIRSEE